MNPIPTKKNGPAGGNLTEPVQTSSTGRKTELNSKASITSAPIVSASKEGRGFEPMATALDPSPVSLSEALQRVANKLSEVGGALDAEYRWMLPTIRLHRSLEEIDIADDLAAGRIDQTEADDRATEDRVTLRRAETDTHLENLRVAYQCLSHAAAYLRGIANASEGAR